MCGEVTTLEVKLTQYASIKDVLLFLSIISSFLVYIA